MKILDQIIGANSLGHENASHVIRLKNAKGYRKRFISNRPNDEFGLNERYFVIPYGI